MREKLIELMDEVDNLCRNTDCEDCVLCVAENCNIIHMADHLLANGVTILKQDGCGYCTEDADGYRSAFGAFAIHNPFHGREWTINTGHCKPRQIYFCPMCGRKLGEPQKENKDGNL